MAEGSREARAAAPENAMELQIPHGPEPIAMGRWHRLFHNTKRACKAGMNGISSIGTALMLLYQYCYPWDKLPAFLTPDPGAEAWVVGLVAGFAYVISKIPHLALQEPGDRAGLIREVLLGIANLLMATVFLARAFTGMNHPANATGVTIFLFILFLILIIGQVFQGMRLAVRTGTWADTSGHSA